MSAGINGVLDVHGLHVWSLSSSLRTISAHVLTEDIAVSAGAEAGWLYISDLYMVDLEVVAAAYKRLSGINAWIYAGPGGGVRQEWVGSFNVVRYPVGGDLGLKALFSARAAITVAYQYRRMLNDPVANFNEHRFVTGISILLNNGRDKTR